LYTYFSAPTARFCCILWLKASGEHAIENIISVATTTIKKSTSHAQNVIPHRANVISGCWFGFPLLG
jgi:hypothetical protein